MVENQFISHSQVVAPSLVPRRGTGIFGALIVVIAVLAGALTGGVWLLEKSLEQRLLSTKSKLVEIHKQTEIESIQQARNLANRISAAERILDNHVYASQVFEFIEKHTLDSMRLNSFAYSGGTISMAMTAPGFVEFAQQVKYYRTVKDLKSFVFPVPSLGPSGEVGFSAELVLSPAYLHARPDELSTASDEAPIVEELPGSSAGDENN